MSNDEWPLWLACLVGALAAIMVAVLLVGGFCLSTYAVQAFRWPG